MEVVCLILICAFENTHVPALPTAFNLARTQTQAPRSCSTLHTHGFISFQCHKLPTVAETCQGWFCQIAETALHFWGDQIMVLQSHKSLLAAVAGTFSVL